MTREEELLALLPELSGAEKERRTREALADVDAGRTIPHDEFLRLLKARDRPKDPRGRRR